MAKGHSDEGSDPKPAPDRWAQAYPKALRCEEMRLLALCKESEQEGGRRMRFGLALSGGGLRSATFALGVVQALANAGALRSVDILSTVSGGGYIGGLINRLFQREAEGVDVTVEEALLPEGRRAGKGLQDCNRKKIEPGSTLRWLRENSNHLAPSGGGDLLVGAAVILRNWMSVLAVRIIWAQTA